MFKKIQVACFSHIGKARKNNEDNYYLNGEYMPSDNKGSQTIKSTNPLSVDDKRWYFYAVFDGMGGGDYGEIASFRCAEATKSFFSNRSNVNLCDITPTLQNLCTIVNDTIFEEKQRLGVYQMGSTLVSAFVFAGKVWMCNIGDSRCYWYRAQEDALYQLSDDHVEERDEGSKPVLLQYFGIDSSMITIEPTIEFFEPNAGDKLLLCSDGLTDMVDENRILEIIDSDNPVNNIRALFSEAMGAGGVDNITMIVLRFS